MNTKTAAAAALKWSRRFLRTVRSLSPMGVIAVTLALVFGGAGIASAANDGNFILSQANTTGGDGFTSIGTNTPLTNSPTQIVSTGALPVGTYYVTATAWLNVHTGDTVGQCFIRNSSTGAHFEWGGSDPGTPEPGASGSELQAAETAAMSATTSGTKFQEWCLAGGNTSGSFASDAGITAIRIANSHGTPPG